MAKHDTLTPELLRILKIFGLASIAFVLILSFFDEKKANNTGALDSELAITDAERLYFKNVRGIFYDIENRADAKMQLYRYGKRIKEAEHPLINTSILINRVKLEAYIFVETNPELNSFELLAHYDNGTDTLIFNQGDKFSHFQFVKKLSPLLENDVRFEMLSPQGKLPVLQNPKEIDALRIPIKDFYRLINQSIEPKE
ncbi:hypothetical protein ACFOUP_06760 [Belliella kenyensis]|uniref:Uncharacterized protein n=1 Tax=Belliella kenyensis TaxID=1472724 RepID=A0ABV8EKG9_9BACT|nr:hypothetical protein [Belliella kenyensis]MCH7401238.1 hypothetical protein [Belliella kenyensis]MDN3602684.1 hypothetical protein [Belliella kenyensis]